MRRSHWLLVGGVLVLAVLAVALVARRYHHGAVEREEREMLLIKHVDLAVLAAETLTELDAGRIDEVQQQLRTALAYSMERTSQLLDTGARPYRPSAGQRRGIDRARAYAEAHGLGDEVLRNSDKLLQAMQVGD
ncbi:MAG: hypothetical protein KBD01_08320 [Acidobacteria bacterium]|nr:hypothetical protein [Acidobacteriota bacterium]